MKRQSLWLLFGLVVVATFFVGGSRAEALTNLGPSSFEFGGASVDYTLSNTNNVKNAQDMSIPFYYQQRPPAGGVTLTINFDKGSGCVKFSFSPFTLTSGNNANPCQGGTVPSTTLINIPQSQFGAAADPTTGLWKAQIYARLPGGISGTNFKNFNVSIPQLPGNRAFIGYSSANSTYFAIANNHRCDIGGDVSGCGQYWNYDLPFGAQCNQAGGDQTITMYDADNPSGTNQYNTQPTPFTVWLEDTTAGTRLDVANGRLKFSGDMKTSSASAYWKFTYIQGHKYQFHIDRVYADNVLQFKLPFDSIYSLVDCHWTLNARTEVYKDAGMTQPLPGNTASPGQTVHFHNYLQNDPDSTQDASIVYGVRYVTISPANVISPSAVGVPINPMAASGRPPSGAGPSGGRACAWPTNPTTGPKLATDPSYNAANCMASANVSGSLGRGRYVSAYSTNAVKIPVGTPNGTRFCEWIAFDPYDYDTDDGALRDGYSKPVCVTVVAATVDCSIVSPNGLNPEVNVPFKIEDSIGAAPPNGTTLGITISGPGLNVPSTNYVFPGGDADYYFPAAGTYTATVGGNYTITYTLNGVLCLTKPFVVGYKPYFDVRGADVVAGAKFGFSQECNSEAKIKSWNYDNEDTDLNGTADGKYFGAGSQFGAFATGDITSFISGLKTSSPLNNGYTQSSPYSLSFANTVDGTVNSPGRYGGQFGSVPCDEDYFAGYDESYPLLLNNPTLLNADLPSGGTHRYVGDLTLSSTTIRQVAATGKGKQITLYIKGNVFIQNNILYGYGDLKELPNLRVHVMGNIYVNATTDTLTGVYTVQEDPDPAVADSGGFYTCATSPSPGVFTPTSNYTNCSTDKLTINGSVSAKKIFLGRSWGTLHGAPADLTKTGQSAAETFQFSPEAWMSGVSSGGGVCSNGACTYDAVTSLPPIL